MGGAKVAREWKTRAPEVPGLSKTREVQNPPDFGLKTLLKSSVEHLYADQKLTNTCQIAEATAVTHDMRVTGRKQDYKRQTKM